MYIVHVRLVTYIYPKLASLAFSHNSQQSVDIISTGKHNFRFSVVMREPHIAPIGVDCGAEETTI